MKRPGKPVLARLPGLGLSFCQLILLIQRQKALKRMQNHVAAVYRAVKCRINSLRIRSNLYGKNFSVCVCLCRRCIIITAIRR